MPLAVNPARRWFSTALNRRIDRRPEIQCLALEDSASLSAAVAAAKGAA